MKFWQPEDGDVGFELTPMIDLVFLLVAFFMTLASVITADVIEGITIPVAGEAKVSEEKRDRQYVSIKGDGSLYFGHLQLNYDELAEHLIKAREENPHLRIYLRADADTPHRYVNEVMASCGQAGIFDLIFAANQS